MSRNDPEPLTFIHKPQVFTSDLVNSFHEQMFVYFDLCLNLDVVYSLFFFLRNVHEEIPYRGYTFENIPHRKDVDRHVLSVDTGFGCEETPRLSHPKIFEMATETVSGSQFEVRWSLI